MTPTTAGTGDADASTEACDDSGRTGAADGATGRGVLAASGATVGLTGFLVGLGVGLGVALATGFRVGFAVGLGVGRGVGLAVGFGVGLGVGFAVGLGVGFGVGGGVGTGVGVAAGPTVNDPPGTSQVSGGVTVCVPGVTRKIVLRVPFVKLVRTRL
jgi:hypothetical protein